MGRLTFGSVVCAEEAEELASTSVIRFRGKVGLLSSIEHRSGNTLTVFRHFLLVHANFL